MMTVYLIVFYFPDPSQCKFIGFFQSEEKQKAMAWELKVMA